MYYRTRFRIVAALLVVCVIAAAFPGAALAADRQTGTVHTANEVKNLGEIVANANNGDVIEITGTCMTNDNNTNTPWVIDKAVTIRGVSSDASLNLRAGGILLAADVTFENLELAFPNRVRNAIMANGHTLILRNVTRSKSANNDVHLFCGGATGLSINVPSGDHGNIIVENCPEMGNVYAGSISTDGKPNGSSIPATVTMKGTSKAGKFYACGALETHVDDNEMMNPNFEVAPPTPSPTQFPVTGDVTFNLYYTSTSMVDGDAGGGKKAAVVYTANGNLNESLTLKNLSKLTVGSGGNLTPTAESLLVNAELVVPASSVLSLTKLTTPTAFASLQGGGTLVLGREQTLTIKGSVSGKTGIGIGRIFNGLSQQMPITDRVYVQAPYSSNGNFELLCPSNKPNLKLVLDNTGRWNLVDDSPGGEEEPSKLVSFAPEDVQLTSQQSADSAVDGIAIPLKTVYSGDPLDLEDVLQISVNSKQAQFFPDSDWDYYEAAGLRIFVGDTGDGDELIIYDGKNPYVAPVSDGVYRIEIIFPGIHTNTGDDLSATCTLTVGDSVTPPPTDPSHTHNWSAAWSSNANYHWHDCQAAGCPIQENNKKDGYALHKAGDWIIDKEATSSQPGSRHKECTTCGYVTVKETIPATDSGSSGGDSSGGGSSGGGTAPNPPQKPDIEDSAGGSTSVIPAKPGGTAIIQPKPDPGYKVDKITVTDQNGKPVVVTMKPDGTYTFQQPDGEVKIEVAYKPVGAPWENPFTDIAEGDWYYEAVGFVQEVGLMNGYGDGNFAPHAQLSRAQLAQILFNKEGRPGVDSPPNFSDVEGEAWYTEAIQWAASQGIVGGYGNGNFGPGDPITREQMAVMLWRYSGSPDAANKELHFLDEGEITGFALEALRWAVENGILNGYGDGRLGPQGQATRAQVAQILKNFLENQEDNAIH